jgi:protein kinase C substrate 80K-H
VLPSARVNDDYCDCPDGSDEPGTSACAYLSHLSPSSPADIPISDTNTTLALPGFYCKNKGHQASYLPFLSVNDGVCDYELCCDGSDEWAGVGGTKCEDRCKEIGKEWRKNDERRKKSMAGALKKRRELVVEAGRLRKEVEDRIGTLKAEIGASEVKVKNLEQELADVERRERGKVVKGGGPGKSKVNVLAGLAKERVEELRETLIDVRAQRDMVKERMGELEAMLTKFKEEYNPNFNDEGVKRAVRSWEEYAAKDKVGDTEEAYERDLDEIVKPDDAEGGVNWAEWDTVEEESDVEVCTSALPTLLFPTITNHPFTVYQLENYLPPTLRLYIDAKLRSLRVWLIDNGILAASAPTTESPLITAARSSLDSARSSLTSQQNQLRDHESDLTKDFGPDSVFRALKGQCVSKDSGEYTYELCWLDRTKQKSKKGGPDVGMGNFVRIDKVMVDDALPADGRGLGSGERVALRYENGQHCWNGPHRSTLVVLACAEKDEIWKIAEEEKCVYRMEVGTPAVCEDNGKGKGKGGARDEL